MCDGELVDETVAVTLRLPWPPACVGGRLARGRRPLRHRPRHGRGSGLLVVVRRLWSGRLLLRLAVPWRLRLVLCGRSVRWVDLLGGHRVRRHLLLAELGRLEMPELTAVVVRMMPVVVAMMALGLFLLGLRRSHRRCHRVRVLMVLMVVVVLMMLAMLLDLALLGLRRSQRG